MLRLRGAVDSSQFLLRYDSIQVLRRMLRALEAASAEPDYARHADAGLLAVEECLDNLLTCAKQNLGFRQ